MWHCKGSHGYGHKNECVQCETGQYTQNAFFVLCFAAFLMIFYVNMVSLTAALCLISFFYLEHRIFLRHRQVKISNIFKKVFLDPALFSFIDSSVQ